MKRECRVAREAAEETDQQDRLQAHGEPAAGPGQPDQRPEGETSRHIHGERAPGKPRPQEPDSQAGTAGPQKRAHRTGQSEQGKVGDVMHA